MRGVVHSALLLHRMNEARLRIAPLLPVHRSSLEELVMSTILLIVLIILLFAALPAFPYRHASYPRGICSRDSQSSRLGDLWLPRASELSGLITWQFRFWLEVLISSVITALGPIIALRTAKRPAEPPAEKTSSRRRRRKVARPGPPGSHAIRIARLIRHV